jgi:predicted permease
MLGELSGILLPVFCLAGVGYGWRRLGFPFEREFVTRMILNVSGPCLIVDSLAGLSMPMDEFARMAAGAVSAKPSDIGFFVAVCLVVRIFGGAHNRQLWRTVAAQDPVYSLLPFFAVYAL